MSVENQKEEGFLLSLIHLKFRLEKDPTPRNQDPTHAPPAPAITAARRRAAEKPSADREVEVRAIAEARAKAGITAAKARAIAGAGAKAVRAAGKKKTMVTREKKRISQN